MLQDLHLHSTFSDGALTPSELVRTAKSKGLKLIAITDHDTVSGVAEGIEEGKKLKINVLPGIEVSTYDEGEVHILGYNIDCLNNDNIKNFLNDLTERRIKRNIEIIKKLNSLGYKIDYKEIIADQSGSVGRYRIAKILKQKGYVASESEAFEKLLKKGRPAHVDSFKLSPLKAIEIIVGEGGIPVLAHPKLISFYSEIENYIKILCDAGLKGIECYYPAHTNSDVKELVTLCNKYKLIKTGGSDFHSDSSVCSVGGIVWGMDSFTAEVLQIENK